ncbi:YXWGXW repeat-containing protein [bacterium]|nr:YXWGXW repeat-containing protein [bacterium]
MRRHKLRMTLLVLLGLIGAGCVVYPSRRAMVVQDDPGPPPAPVYDGVPPSAESPGMTFVVEAEPPPVRYEVITSSPGVDFEWVGGYWACNGSWVWCPGSWHRCPPGYHWQAGVWVRVGGRSHWHPGGWVRHR